MVTAEQVWAALDEIPDPEIPVISLVDLGVIRDVQVAKGHVRVEFTPTFMGCPALEVMRDQMAERITELGAEAEIDVILDDSWSTDRISPAGREKLRQAGFAPPAPRPVGGVQLVQLQTRRVSLPLLRLDRDAAREHLRPDAVPVGALLHELQPAVRAVQDDLGTSPLDPLGSRDARACSWPAWPPCSCSRGCGGGGDDKLSDADFRSKANTLCLAYSQKVNSLPDPGGYEALAQYAADAHKALVVALDGLKELHPSDELAGRLRHLARQRRPGAGARRGARAGGDGEEPARDPAAQYGRECRGRARRSSWRRGSASTSVRTTDSSAAI